MHGIFYDPKHDELVLPVALSAAFLLAMAGYTRHWDLHAPFGLAAFGALLVVLSLFVSLRVDGYTLKRREERGSRQLLNRADPRWRLVFAEDRVLVFRRR